MGNNCSPLLADLFLFSYEAEFIEELIKTCHKDLAKSFNFTFRYIDDVLSLNNKKFTDYIHRIYPPELEIKDTTDSSTSAAYLDLFLQGNQQGHLLTKSILSVMVSIFLSWISHSWVVTYLLPLHTAYIHLSWYDMLEHPLSTRTSLTEVYY